MGESDGVGEGQAVEPPERARRLDPLLVACYGALVAALALVIRAIVLAILTSSGGFPRATAATLYEATVQSSAPAVVLLVLVGVILLWLVTEPAPSRLKPTRMIVGWLVVLLAAVAAVCAVIAAVAYFQAGPFDALPGGRASAVLSALAALVPSVAAGLIGANVLRGRSAKPHFEAEGRD